MSTPRLPVDPVRPGDDLPPPVDKLAAARHAAVTRGGISLGSPFGVPVRVSVIGLVIAVFLSYGWFSGYAEIDGTGLSTSQVQKLALLGGLLLELSVLAHEIAHCWVAKRSGLEVGALRLFAFGGLSEIEVETESPRREAAVVLAGPLVSVLIASISGAAFLASTHGSITAVDGDYDPFVLLVAWLAVLNTGLAIFNLLPGLPLDGGRLLRAAIWGATGKPDLGLKVAGYAGYVVAMAAIADALSGDQTIGVFLAFCIAFYITHNARQAISLANLGDRAADVQIGSLVRNALRVAADTPLAEAIRRAKATGSRALLIVDSDGSPQAIASDLAIDAVPEQRRPWVPVSDVSQPIVAGLILDARLAGAAALDAMRSHPSGEYLVVSPEDVILGVLSRADVAGVLQHGRPS